MEVPHITPEGIRVAFAVDSSGRCTELIVSHEVSAAYDIMTDDGVSPETAAKYAHYSDIQNRDAEAFARHFVKLRKALREDS